MQDKTLSTNTMYDFEATDTFSLFTKTSRLVTPNLWTNGPQNGYNVRPLNFFGLLNYFEILDV